MKDLMGKEHYWHKIPYIISEKQCLPFFYRQPTIWITPTPLLPKEKKKILSPLSMIFQKSYSPWMTTRIKQPICQKN